MMSTFKSTKAAAPVEFKGQLQTKIMRKFHSKINVLYEQDLADTLDVYRSIVTLYTIADQKVCYRFPAAIFPGFPSNVFKLACEQKAAEIAIKSLDQTVIDNPAAFIIEGDDLSSSSVSPDNIESRKDWKGDLINLLHQKHKGSVISYPFTQDGFPAQFVSTLTIVSPEGRKIEFKGKI